MSTSAKNVLIAALVAVIAVLLVALYVIIQGSNYKVANMESEAAALQKSLRGGNSQGNAQSNVPNVTATGDHLEIIAAAKQQGKVDEADIEDEAPLSTLSDAELNSMLNEGGAQ
jgi:hypothetical protein